MPAKGWDSTQVQAQTEMLVKDQYELQRESLLQCGWPETSNESGQRVGCVVVRPQGRED